MNSNIGLFITPELLSLNLSIPELLIAAEICQIGDFYGHASHFKRRFGICKTTYWKSVKTLSEKGIITCDSESKSIRATNQNGSQYEPTNINLTVRNTNGGVRLTESNGSFNGGPSEYRKNIEVNIEDKKKIIKEKKSSGPNPWLEKLERHFERLWKDFPKHVNKHVAKKHFLTILGKKETKASRVELAFQAMAIERFTAEMQKLVERDGNNKMVTRLSVWFSQKHYEDDSVYGDLRQDAIDFIDEVDESRASEETPGSVPHVEANA